MMPRSPAETDVASQTRQEVPTFPPYLRDELSEYQDCYKIYPKITKPLSSIRPPSIRPPSEVFVSDSEYEKAGFGPSHVWSAPVIMTKNYPVSHRPIRFNDDTLSRNNTPTSTEYIIHPILPRVVRKKDTWKGFSEYNLKPNNMSEYTDRYLESPVNRTEIIRHHHDCTPPQSPGNYNSTNRRYQSMNQVRGKEFPRKRWDFIDKSIGYPKSDEIYKPSSTKMDFCTTNKADYIKYPVKLPDKRELREYRRPNTPLNAKIIHRSDFVEHKPKTPEHKDLIEYHRPNETMQSETLYQKDYKGKETAPCARIIPKHELTIGDFHHPEHRANYIKWQNDDRKENFAPKRRTWRVPSIKMSDITTTVNDYRGHSPTEEVRPIRHRGHLTHHGAFHDDTVYNTEYIERDIPSRCDTRRRIWTGPGNIAPS